ncbi:MAG TPA: di-heme oxidoredictase family protein [Thermoanaerobaculia bacterium]
MSDRTRKPVLALCAAALFLAGGLACQKAAPPPATGAVSEKAPARTPEKEKFTVDLVEKPAFPLEKHLEQKDIAAGSIPFAKLFDDGDKLFHTPYNGLDGVGMKHTVAGVAINRFSIGPVAGSPVPVGAQSCGSCHATPFGASAGLAHTRVFFDPDQNGLPPVNPRATTSLFGDGVLQLVAEEMTEKLLAARDAAAESAKAKPGTPATQPLTANGVDFGTITATASASGDVKLDVSKVRGVSPDLVVRPFGWKGNVTTIRNFNVAAASFGMGMQAEEFVWRLPEKAGPDPDGDGVTRELSVGDITAMTIYNAAQEAPTELSRLVEQGVVPAPDQAARGQIDRGRTLFTQVGCVSCHMPEMHLANTVFEEPTKRGGGQYLDAFLAGKTADYDPAHPARFDVLKDSQEPRIQADPKGGAVVRLYGDLKRHEMGRQLAEPAPVPVLHVTLAPLQHDGKVVMIPATQFLTPELWGVGNTGPYLHDDRAGTLAEAIALHGEDAPPAMGQPGRSEAQEARDAYMKLPPEDQRALVAFLKSLVTYSQDR